MTPATTQDVANPLLHSADCEINHARTHNDCSLTVAIRFFRNSAVHTVHDLGHSSLPVWIRCTNNYYMHNLGRRLHAERTRLSHKTLRIHFQERQKFNSTAVHMGQPQIRLLVWRIFVITIISSSSSSSSPSPSPCIFKGYQKGYRSPLNWLPKPIIFVWTEIVYVKM